MKLLFGGYHHFSLFPMQIRRDDFVQWLLGLEFQGNKFSETDKSTYALKYSFQEKEWYIKVLVLALKITTCEVEITLNAKHLSVPTDFLKALQECFPDYREEVLTFIEKWQ